MSQQPAARTGPRTSPRWSERLAAIPGLLRGPLEFAQLAPGDRLYQRALRDRPDPPATLWARRSWFEIDGDRLLVQEVFLPEAHA